MAERYFTHAMWQVKEGSEGEFERIWREELARAFRAVSPRATGTLIQSLDDPRRYFSFGPWPSLDDMQRARSDPSAQQALAKLRALCETATPGAFRVVLTIP
jgi:heme-degrading monooxygenase HmoA